MLESHFLKDWWFFTGTDPTNGKVTYEAKDDALREHLTYFQPDGAIVLAVDDYSHVPAGGNRNSVRIQSEKTYSNGLFIADIQAMPYGCGVWPAYWSCGPNWPYAGEIDIVEGVNLGPLNQYTLHSAPNSTCELSTGGLEVLGSVMGKLCASSEQADAGCAYQDGSSTSYGKEFNAAGGGIFAHLWDSTGITMWRFTRSQIPADITAKKPDPSSWPTPVGYWSSNSCDLGSYFYDHTLIFDTTVCGGWANSTYPRSGCPGTCSEMVANASNFATAKWIINYLAVYQ